MANHIRRQVRDAIATQLTGLATTGARVHVNAVDAFAASALPALTITNGVEQIDRQSLGAPNVYVRRIQTIVVTALARATTSVWNDLDQIVQEVEVAMLGSIDAILLGGLAVDMTLLTIDEPLISGDADRMVGSVSMRFQVLINAREGIPDAVI